MTVFLTVASVGLSLAVLFLPLRYAMLSYLVMVHFDFSGAYFDSSDAIGLQNAIKVVILPIVLWMRCGPQARSTGTWKRIGWIWLLLSGYAAVSVLWSPLAMAGLKMVGYLASTAILFLVLRFAWVQGWLTLKLVRWSWLFGLLLGLLQSQYFGNPFGTMDEVYFSPRFTSFTSPQSFAVFLLAVIAMELARRRSDLWRYVVIGTSVVALFWSGSRYSFVGLVALLVVGTAGRTLLTVPGMNLGRMVLRSVGALVIAACMAVMFIHYAPGSRLSELLAMNPSDPSSLEDVATVAWRWNIYQDAINDLASRNTMAVFMGTGTSSGGEFGAAHAEQFFGIEDPNRVFHNEFLRALYEWGLLGSGLLLALLALIAQKAWGLFRSGCRAGLAALAILPVLFSSLMVENILANSGSPGMTGLLLVLSLACASGPRRKEGFELATPVAAGRPHRMQASHA